MKNRTRNAAETLLSPGAFLAWRDFCPRCSVMAYQGPRNDVVFGAPPGQRYVRMMWVSSNFLSGLGTAPLVGRFFTEGEDLRGGFSRRLVVSEGFWRDELRGDPLAIGKNVTIDGADYEVIGVAPRSLWWPQPVDLWRPLVLDPAGSRRGNSQRSVNVMVRLDASADPTSVATGLGRAATEWIEAQEFRVQIVALKESWYGPVWTTLAGLVATLSVLVLGSYASLLFFATHIKNRSRREIAVHLALGATPKQAVRTMLLAYSVALFAALAVAGMLSQVVLTAFVETGALLAPKISLFTLPVLAVSMAAALVAMALMVAVSMYGLQNTNAWQVLRLNSEGRVAPSRNLGIVSLQSGLAVVITTFALLSLFTEQRHARRGVGYVPTDVNAAAISVPFGSYREISRLAQLEQDLLRSLLLAGLSKPVVAGSIPSFETGTRFVSVRQFGVPEDRSFMVGARSVSPDYFELLGMSLLAGRGFSNVDTSEARAVAVISLSTANKLGIRADELPVECLVAPDFSESRTIVGILADVDFRDRGEEDQGIYFPFAQMPVLPIFVAYSSANASSSVLAERLRLIDPSLQVLQLHSLADRIAALQRPRVVARRLLLLLAILSMAVMVLGVGSLARQIVVMRGKETAIRLALGAGPSRIVIELFGQICYGIAVGLAGGAVVAVFLVVMIGSLVESDNTRIAIAVAVATLVVTGSSLMSFASPVLTCARGVPSRHLASE